MLLKKLKEIIEAIVAQPETHGKWLNSLSLMENTGARKISASEHPTQVDLMILKHAAEEARHAYYLKKQIERVLPDSLKDFSFENLLAPLRTYHYLHSLDAEASRYIKDNMKLDGYELKYAAYLLVTYAIEVRADELYPVYQDVLTKIGSKVNVKAIILEEEGHLEEMEKQLKDFSSEWEHYAHDICQLEEQLFEKWITSIGKQLELPETV
ncbi:MAG: bacterioferritin (cytochrome b1) [Sphingobacteriales bacterium]|jgi:bacterioferritin (cytochrome b1)